MPGSCVSNDESRKHVSIKQAAKLLRSRLQDAPWVTAVGVGEQDGSPCIVLYVKTLTGIKTDFLDQGWKGFPVVVRKMGSPRLVASFWPSEAKPTG